MNDTPEKETPQNPSATTPPPAPRRASIVTICTGAGLLVGTLIGFGFVPKAVALAMFFGAAFGAGIGTIVEASRRKNR